MESFRTILTAIHQWQNDFLGQVNNFTVPSGNGSLREKAQVVARNYFNSKMDDFISTHPNVDRKGLIWLKNARHQFVVVFGRELKHIWKEHRNANRINH